MKYITEYRDKELAKKLVADIAKEARPDRNYRLMEFCGGHTHVISRYGLEGILPKNVRMIHGPGCPVCVMPIGRIDSALNLPWNTASSSAPTQTPCAFRLPRDFR